MFEKIFVHVANRTARGMQERTSQGRLGASTVATGDPVPSGGYYGGLDPAQSAR
jgi:hypothetical protein